ncbi:hypothetical protein [uncultured Vibrio sp.]|uniref:hypothetical protein n=1 Tax=uncultured Vibrio sp. TaxID=114054 RepID=UPI0025E7DDCA|nr:hypothetical protein [uncultured Vibrio sp.]
MRHFSKLITLSTLLASSLIFAEENVAEVTKQLTSNPSEEQILITYQSNPDLVLEILAILLSTENVDAQTALQNAMEVAPDRVEEIAELARKLGVSNEVITTAALISGIDPTQVSEATAAGIETVANAPNTGSQLAPPSAPPVGGNGGGGNGVVSPN